MPARKEPPDSHRAALFFVSENGRLARFERSAAFESAVGIFARQAILFFAGTLPAGGREIGDCAGLIVPRFAALGEERFFAPRRGCLRIDEAHIRERRTGGMVAMIGFLGSTKSGGGKHAVSFQEKGVALSCAGGFSALHQIRQAPLR
jgi:hypothetical protein